jgi:hypothetical protein
MSVSVSAASLAFAALAASSLPASWQRFDGDARNLQCYGGTAPVTKRSGKYRHCHQRWACDKHLRRAMHLFTEQSLSRCAWAQTYYEHHQQNNQSHADALRRLGHRWLKIIHKMWIDRTINSNTALGSFN